MSLSLSAAVLCGLIVSGFGVTTEPADAGNPDNWRLWSAYKQHFISPDGRVVDRLHGEHSTSEGQAYALFFSLVANDRRQFALILEWTENNLAGGDLRRNLPSWKWGKTQGDEWGVLDENAASDADLWLAYTLLEAGRLWCDQRYSEVASDMVHSINTMELADIPELGAMLMPGPVGFTPPEDSRPGEQIWRLNPSYLAMPLLRRFAALLPESTWPQIASNAADVILLNTHKGFVPDWVAYKPAKPRRSDKDAPPVGAIAEHFVVDPKAGSRSSFDAIRAYLWAFLLPAADAQRASLVAALDGPLREWRRTGRVPVTVDFEGSGEAKVIKPAKVAGPAGFYLILYPVIRSTGTGDELTRLRLHLMSRKAGELYGSPPDYYDQNLALFAEGFIENRYAFAVDGRLEPRWESRCE